VNSPGGHDSGWIRTPTYTDVNLASETQYCYRVMARDMSTSQNQTAWSDWMCGITQPGVDITPPTPNPAQFDPNGLPREYDGYADPGDKWVEMAAVVAVDDSGGPVQYYFWCKDEDKFSSGWIDQPIYRVKIGVLNRGWEWHVRTRDAAGNVTIWSTPGERQMQRPSQPALGAGFTRNIP
jgi:hypothetical protein